MLPLLPLPSLRSPRGPLAALVLANAVSWHGSAVSQIAVPWFVLHSTGSAALTGAVAALGLAGGLVSLLFGPALVERLGLRETSVLGDLLSAVAVAALPLLAAGPGAPFAVVAALAFLRALLDGPGSTARASLLPELAARADVPLERVNTLSEVAESGAGWTGPLVAGLLVAALGAPNTLWFDAASFALSALLIGLAVPRVRPAPADGPLEMANPDRFAGWRFLWRDGPVRAIFVTGAVFCALMPALFAVVLPLKARGAGALGLGAFVSAFGLGSVLGALAFGRWGAHWSRRAAFLASVSGLGAVFLGLAVAPNAVWGVLVCFLGGLIGGTNGPLIPTVLQERTPPALRPRVFAATAAIGLAAAPIGVALAGLALDRFPLQPVLLGLGALFFLGVLAVALDPGLKEADGPRP